MSESIELLRVWRLVAEMREEAGHLSSRGAFARA
jgi:hypothetical protein